MAEIKSKKPTLDQLNELYIKTYRTRGVAETYTLLRNSTDNNNNVLIRDYIISTSCAEFCVSKETLWNGTSKGNRTLAMLSVIKLLGEHLQYDIDSLKSLTDFTYQNISKLKKRLLELDINIKPDRELIEKIQVVNDRVIKYINNLNNKKDDATSENVMDCI